MSYATFQDVEDRFFRTLTEEERPLVEARIRDVENKIRMRILDLDERVIENPLLGEIVGRICADAVIRLVRNPEGYVQETDGNYTYMLAQAHADGRLSILPDEWEDLGVRKGVAVFHVIPRLPDSLRGGITDESFRPW